MERTQLQENKRDLAVLVGLRSPVLREDSTDEESLAELAALVDTAGGQVVGSILQSREKPDPHSFIGEGKVEEVKTMVTLEKATLVIFDNDLSPSQIRVLTELLGVQVIDRSGLILDIFAQRAKTKEGCLQVELAQYQYLLPRLIGMWTHLERQAGTSGKGPIGSKGPGETQLETDRRHIHLSLKPERVINDVINNGVVSKIDTATVNGVPFISIAGIGFDALVANFFANDPRRGLKTYLKFITEEYPRFKPNFYHVILDSGLEFDCKPLFVSFANSNQFGFNASVSPKASLNDGMLDVCIFKKPNILEVGYVAERLITNNIDKTQFVDIYKAKSIKVIREKEDFVNIDGEAVMMQKDIEIVNNHLSLNILLPNTI